MTCVTCVTHILIEFPRSKIIENLAVINYDTNNLNMAAYDWRLSYYNLEVRDGYFSRWVARDFQCASLTRFVD